MNSDTIRLIFTYLIAAGSLVGLFLLLFLPTPEIPSEAKLALVTTNLGLVLGWALNKESTTGGNRSTERAITLGATTATPTKDPQA